MKFTVNSMSYCEKMKASLPLYMRERGANTHRQKKNHPSPWVGKKWEGRPPLGFWRLPRKIKLVYSTVLTRTMISTTTRLSIRSNRTKESAKNKKVRSASVRKTYWTITEFMYWDHLGGTIPARDIPLTVTQCNFWFVSTNTRSC